jgi:hypothetical protein
MIISILFYIVGFIFSVLAGLLPVWSAYPPEILQGLIYFGSCLIKINFIIDTYSLSCAVVFLVQFFAVYYSARLIVSMISAIRGHKIIDI